MVAKCRKAHGQVRKSKKGASLKRWQKEKWKDKITGNEHVIITTSTDMLIVDWQASHVGKAEKRSTVDPLNG